VAPNRWAGVALALAVALLLAGGSAAAAQQTAAELGSVRARLDSTRPAQPAGAPAAAKVAPAPAKATPAPAKGVPAVPVARVEKRAAAAPAPADSAKKTEDTAPADSLKPRIESDILRETFSYSGAPRDPFASLIKTAHAGPELSDLLLVGIYEDLRYSGNSVVVLRDKTSGKRYKLHPGEQVGRIRVNQIRTKDVVFTVSDFGYERQETLSLRKQEVVTP
jgi:hypothetical protein